MAVASACVLALSHAQSLMADEFGTGMKRKTSRLLVPPDDNSSCRYLAPPRVRRRPRSSGERAVVASGLLVTLFFFPPRPEVTDRQGSNDGSTRAMRYTATRPGASFWVR